MAKVALLVGVSEYEPGLNPLPGAVKDVDAVREVLLHPEMGGFAESDILLLKNPERQDVEMAIETLFSGRHKDDLVLLYFSGHGIKDDRGRLYLATRTTRKTTQGELIRSTAVSANSIHDRMSESRSRRQVVILDSCFSGAFAEGLSAKDDGSIDIREQLGGEGRVVLTSSSSTQYSFEEQGQDLSIYTRFLIEGIKSGEADRDEDEFISIDELHEYASQKVRDLRPAMKPEIYAIREGFKIRLSKVAPGDPSQRYRKEVTRFIHRGDISFVGRRTLDVLRSRLGLEATEAKAIEDEVLEPYRKEFREKLQQYEQVFTELLERDETITEGDRRDLQNLQQILGLRNEDTMPIEAQVTARFKSHQENLQAYEQAFCSAVWQEYPLSAANRDRLRQMQQQLNLTAPEVEAIESRITAEVQAYHQKLQEYERLFANATQQEYPLSEASQVSLQQQQQRLGLKDGEIAPIEAKITTQIETYHQKLQQYEQAFVKATQRKHYPDEVTCKQLQQTWQTLELSEIDIETIESRINREIKTHQENLRQYEMEFTEAVQQEYPLSAIKRAKLTERYRSLNLTAEDVEAIENPMVEAIEEHQQKLQQYEQVFRESIQFEYPLSDATREELQRFQQVLDLSDATIFAIEQQVIETFQPLQDEGLKPSLLDDQGLVSTPIPSVQVSIPEQNRLVLQGDQSTLLSSMTETTNDSSPKLLKNNLVGKNLALNPSLSSVFSKKKNRFLFYIALPIISGILMYSGVEFLQKAQRKTAQNLIRNARILQMGGQSDRCIDILANAKNYGYHDIADEQNRLRDQCQIGVDMPKIFFLSSGQSLTAQEIDSLNSLFEKFRFRTTIAIFEAVEVGSTTTYRGWKGICIGERTDYPVYGCIKSAQHEILSYGSENRLIKSRGWVLYKP